MRRLSELAVNPNGFAFDPSFGDSFLMNESGMIAARALSSGDIESAAKELSETYGIAENEALSDLFDFLAKLRILGFQVE